MNNNENDLVVYVQCPHCKKGWYGKGMGIKQENGKITEYLIEGMNPTDLCKPLTCLNCGRMYTPVEDSKFDGEVGKWLIKTTSVLKEMNSFVARLLTTCTGK